MSYISFTWTNYIYRTSNFILQQDNHECKLLPQKKKILELVRQFQFQVRTFNFGSNCIIQLGQDQFELGLFLFVDS